MTNIKLTKRDLESAEKKKNIYNSAVSLFKQYGYENTTMEDICRASGMSKGSVYHFFTKKVDLLYNFFAELDQHAQDSLEISDKNLAQPAVALLNYCVGVSDAYEQLGYDLAVQLQNVYSEYSSQKSEQSLSFITDISDFISVAQKKGTFSDDLSALEAAHCIHIASVGVFRKWIVDGGVYSMVDVNRWFLPRIINAFVSPSRQISPQQCPERFQRLN